MSAVSALAPEDVAMRQVTTHGEGADWVVSVDGVEVGREPTRCHATARADELRAALAPEDVAAPRRRRYRPRQERRACLLRSDARHEELVDLVAALEPVTSTELAVAMGEWCARVHHALLELEAMGSVVRTGSTRGTRWWLG